MDNYILKFWEGKALREGSCYKASWGDLDAINLEVGFISGKIAPFNKVLDVGCSNGYSAVEQLKRKTIDIVGVDFSQAMIREAKKRKRESKLETIKFCQGDVRDLKFKNNFFDVVYTTRVLINLPTWESQEQGILECLRVCKPGGTVLLLEAFWEPLVKLNAIRAVAGLGSLVEHDFNRYIKKAKLETFLNSFQGKIRYSNVDFSSTYYLGSRFIRELTDNYKEYPGYTNPINKFFGETQIKYPTESFGIQQAYIIEKGENL